MSLMANARAFSETMLSLGLLQKAHSVCGMGHSFVFEASKGKQFIRDPVSNFDTGSDPKCARVRF
jgi:hypothetical protein